MKNFLFNLLVILGKLWVVFTLLSVLVLVIPMWIVLEFILYMEKVMKTRSQRTLTEYID